MSAHVADRLSAYLDQEVSVAEAAAVREHLAGCEACATRLAHLAAVDGRLRDLPAPAPVGYFDSFSSRVRTRIETAQRPRARFRVPAWSWAVAAAVLVAVVVPRMAVDRHAPEASPAKAPASANVPGPATPAATLLPQQAQGDAPASASPAAAERLRSLGYVAPSAEVKTQRGGAEPMAATPAPAAAPGRPAPPKREAETAFAAPPPAAPPAPMARAAQPPPKAPAGPAESGKAAGLTSDKLDAAGAAAKVATAEAGLRDEARVEVAEASRDLEKDNRQGEDLKLAEQPAAADAAPGRADEQKKSRRVAATGTMAQAPPSLAETEYRGLESRGAGTSLAAEREAWRAFAVRHPEDPRADEARVRVVSLGVELARQTGAEDDRARARKDAADYLARKDAAQKERVRSLLEGLAP